MAPKTRPHLQPPPTWSAIPLDLAVLVLGLIPAKADRARFAAVCPQWRAAARLPLAPPQPLLVLPDGTFYSLPSGKRYRFPGCGFAGYKSTCGSWLVFPQDDGCFLVDPFSRAAVMLPALSCVRLRPPNAVAKWSYEHGEKVPDPYLTWMHMSESDDMHISKLILCSPNLVAALVGNWHRTQILICQPGALSWSVRAYDMCKRFQDMVFFQGNLYAIAADENLLLVNISQDYSTGDPQVSRIGQVIRGAPSCSKSSVSNYYNMCRQKIYLVESRGALLMVRRSIWCRLPELEDNDEIVPLENKFEVFKADFENSRWVNVTTFGNDQFLFLGRRCSRAVSVPPNGIPGDIIFFLDDDDENCFQYGYEDEENTSFSCYDMRSRSVSSALSKISWKRGDEMRLAGWVFPQDQ